MWQISRRTDDCRPSESEAAEIEAFVEVVGALVDALEDLRVAFREARWDLSLITSINLFASMTAQNHTPFFVLSSPSYPHNSRRVGPAFRTD